MLKNGHHECSAKTVLDSGSEISIISAKCFNKLQLRGTPVTISIVGAGGVITQRYAKKCELTVVDASGIETQIECLVLNEACGKTRPISKEIMEAVKGQFNVDVSNLETGNGDVDLLLGMSYPHLHQQFSMRGSPGDICVIETRFGPCVVGPVAGRTNYEMSDAVSANSISVDEIKITNPLQYLEAELAGITQDCRCRIKSDDEIIFDEKLNESWQTSSDGRLIVSLLPWKLDRNTLENNRVQGVSRDIKLMESLKKRPEVLKLVQEQIDEMKREGILQKVETTYPKRYLPLLAVVNWEKESTKVRICLDAAAKYKGVSLNDALMKGKLEMMDVFMGLTRFRAGEYALLGDIRKMFWQFLLSPEDARFHGVIWNGETYVNTRVCFGDKNSPPIADRGMLKIATCGKETHPLAYDAIVHKRYVDDIADAGSTETIVVQKRDEVDELLGRFGFQIKQWYSNSSRIGKSDVSTKVLGLKWHCPVDVLSLNISKLELEVERFTKRRILSNIASVWDPIGSSAGFVMKAKLILQSVTRMKVGWDEEVTDMNLYRKWEAWLSQLAQLGEMVMGRSLLPTKCMENCDLVGFSDGSDVGYGCVVYLRWSDKDESNVEIKFVGAKGKVGAIGGNTIPRQELCGALMLARLSNSAEEALKRTELCEKIQSTKLFCDSTTVLSWINSEAIRYKPYVKNKIIEIQELQPVKNWSYVTSRKNKAADLLSKGCDVKNLSLILEGPDMLKQPKTSWEQPVNEEEMAGEEEVRRNVNVITTKDEFVIDVSRFSSWKKLLRVTAYVRTFVRAFVRSYYRRVLNRETPIEAADGGKVPAPTSEEIRKAKNYWVKVSQKSLDMENDEIKKLAPFEDDEGILRVYGRLKESKVFDKNRVHPILLPKNHVITNLIVSGIHETSCHPGHLRVIAECRKEYWVIGIRNLTKSIGRKCVTCRRWRGAALEQFMSNLPDFRITPGLPFENCSVDYFGPFEIRFGLRQRKKAYGALFTCLTTRAVHIELATDLSTDKFLMALRRFVSVYGLPRFMRSDNGSNFRGAASEIKKMVSSWKSDNKDSELMQNYMMEYCIKWTFSTPTASHHNGAVESLVKSVKSALNKIVKERALTEEEYRTIFCEITTCINSRPLWPADTVDNNLPPITCNDLLRPSGGLDRDPITMNLSCNPRKRHRYVQGVVDEWWRLWVSHFTPNLQVRSKWYKKRENLVIGDVVLLMDDTIPRGKWKLGLVVAVYPGKDGLVRSARLKCGNKEYDRPISKLCLLLSKEELKENEVE